MSFDGGSHTLTLKAQVLTETEKEVGRFKVGERVTMTARQRPASDAQAVTVVDRYVEPISRAFQRSGPGVRPLSQGAS